MLGLILTCVSVAYLSADEPKQEAVVTSLLMREIPDVHGKEVVMTSVEHPPDSASPTHRHNAYEFVSELEGALRMQVTRQEALTLKSGETFYENPDDIYQVSGNASDTLPVRFLVINGPIIGISGTLDGGPEPVAEPPPQPSPPPQPASKAAPPPPPSPPADGDKDGVTDDKDRCPHTWFGWRVDTIGCWRSFCLLHGLKFETNSSKLSAAARKDLGVVIEAYEQLPPDVAAGVKINVEGYTDSTGADAYNQGLSKRRAGSVGGFLRRNGIPASIVSAAGLGEANPVDSNDTAVGRANNRRVLIKVERYGRPCR